MFLDKSVAACSGIFIQSCAILMDEAGRCRLTYRDFSLRAMMSAHIYHKYNGSGKSDVFDHVFLVLHQQRVLKDRGNAKVRNVGTIFEVGFSIGPSHGSPFIDPKSSSSSSVA